MKTYPRPRGVGPNAGSIARRAVNNGILTRPDKCDVCGKKCKPDGHHPEYKNPLDVVWVCRACHIRIDGRIHHLKPDHHDPPKRCKNCSEWVNPMRKGRCNKCYRYFRKHGIERPSYLNHETRNQV